MPARPSLVVLLIVAALPATATPAPVPAGANWSEATFPSSDGVKLHADILRPQGLASDAKPGSRPSSRRSRSTTSTATSMGTASGASTQWRRPRV